MRNDRLLGKVSAAAAIALLSFSVVYAADTARNSGAELPVSSATPTVDTRTNLEKLSDPDYLVRRNAVISLGSEKKKENVPQLLAMLNDENAEVQRAAVKALADTGDTRAVKPLMDKYAGEQNVNLKMSIIIALGDLKSSAALPLIKSALKDPFPGFRNEAVRAMGKIRNPETYPAIVGMLNDEAEGVRVMAADVAGSLRLSSAVPLLIKNLNDRTAVVRKAAAESLGNIGTAASAIPELEKHITDPDQSVVTAAKDAIEKIKTYQARKQADKEKAAAKTPALKKAR